jgi:outer membrane lipoprotein-sorting protein
MPADLLASTLTALQDAQASVPATNKKPRLFSLSDDLHERRRLMFRLMNAAAAAAVLGATVWLAPFRTEASFNDVQASCAKAKNVQFTMVQKLTSKSPTLTMRMTTEGRRFRNDFGDAASTIADIDAGKAVNFVYAIKSYRNEPINPATRKRFPNFTEDLISLPAQQAERMPKEKLDGKNVNVFRLKKFRFFGVDTTKENTDGDNITLWVDPSSNLPVKVEVRIYSAPAKEWSLITMNDIHWNVEIPTNFFSTDVPADFKELPPIDPKTGLPVTPVEKKIKP